jgi:hypothetical protein
MSSDLVSAWGRLGTVEHLPLLIMGGGIPLMIVLRLWAWRRPKALSSRRPGWLARRRARGGIRHRHDRVGVGYASAVSTVHLDVGALNHHGYVGGAPGSGKTSLVRLLVQGFPGPVIALDTKGSPELRETVWSLAGLVWQIGAPMKLDLLDPEPAILAQQLL